VIATSFKLHHGSTAVAPLILVLLGSLNKLQGIGIRWTVSIAVRRTVARGAHFLLAFLTLSDVVLNIFRLDPFTAVCRRAI
jgi:hypothetical protein